MKAVLRPLPVLYACPGCPRYGQLARDVARLLDRRGLGEVVWLGQPSRHAAALATQARSRFPVFAIDGCADGCARRWLVDQGVTPQRLFVITEQDVDRAVERIAAHW